MGVDPSTLNTYDKLYACAERFDEEWRSSMAMKSAGGGGGGGGNRNRRIRAAVTQEAGPSNQNNSETPIRKLTDNERSRLMKEGRCFRCRQTGHMANQCTKFTGNNNSRPMRTVDVQETSSTNEQQVLDFMKNLNSDAKDSMIAKLTSLGF